MKRKRLAKARKGCKKIAYPDKASARTKIQELVAQGFNREGELQPYKCPYCKGGPWHIGHPEGGKA